MLGRRIVLVVVATAALMGCGNDSTASDTKAAEQVAGAFDSTGELARLIQPLEASPDLMMTPDAPTQIGAARDSFTRLVGNPIVCLTFTVTSTSIDVTFRRCVIALIFTLDGSLHADVNVAASTVTTTVSSPNLTLAGPGGSRTLSGSFQLRQPIGTNMPVEFDGNLDFSASNGNQLSLELASQWTVTRVGLKTCVNFTGGAELAGNVLGELGPIALAGDGIQSCRDECPTAGHVELSYGAGNVLVWDYRGGNIATVTAPHGKTVDVTLPCGKKLDGGGDGGSD